MFVDVESCMTSSACNTGSIVERECGNPKIEEQMEDIQIFGPNLQDNADKRGLASTPRCMLTKRPLGTHTSLISFDFPD